MNALLNPKAALLVAELDQAFGTLVPAVEDLLQRVVGTEPTVTEVEPSGVVLTSPLTFPDGIGRGHLAAKLFRYREAVRLDVVVEHNRVFARPDGTPSDRRCFLNDFVASVTLPAGATALPEAFVRHVVAGVAAARDAARRHNRRHKAPWTRVEIVGASE